MSEKTGERVVVLGDWPQPAVVAQSQLFSDEQILVLRYPTADEKIAVIRFPLSIYVVHGAPNDAALGGHSLYALGLKHYSVHEIKNSSLVRVLERRNAVHPRHDRDQYLKDKKHDVFTVQDSTLECVVIVNEQWKPRIAVAATEEKAERFWLAGDA